MAKYLFRIDDIHPKMDWQKFQKLREIFDEFGIKPLLAVIPDNKCAILDKDESNPNFWQIIKKLFQDQWIISMHGYRHDFVNKQSGILKINPFSEFSGLSYSQQSEKIENGKKILQENGIETDVFVAPAHSFDIATIEALKNNGFRYISDGIALWPFKKYNIIWLPQIFSKVRRFPLGFIVFCFHVNNISDTDFQRLKNFIEKNRKSIINFHEFIDMVSNRKMTNRFLIFIPNVILGFVMKIILKFKRNLL